MAIGTVVFFGGVNQEPRTTGLIVRDMAILAGIVANRRERAGVPRIRCLAIPCRE